MCCEAFARWCCRRWSRCELPKIGSSLEAAPTVYLSGAAEIDVDMSELADLCIVSQIRVEAGDGPAEAVRLDDVAGVAVVPTLAEGG